MKMTKNDEWKKENTVIFSLRLQKSTDEDIISWLAKSGNTKAGEIKRLVRIAIAAEQNKQ
jgi:hypothetical protein